MRRAQAGRPASTWPTSPSRVLGLAYCQGLPTYQTNGLTGTPWRGYRLATSSLSDRIPVQLHPDASHLTILNLYMEWTIEHDAYMTWQRRISFCIASHIGVAM